MARLQGHETGPPPSKSNSRQSVGDELTALQPQCLGKARTGNYSLLLTCAFPQGRSGTDRTRERPPHKLTCPLDRRSRFPHFYLPKRGANWGTVKRGNAVTSATSHPWFSVNCPRFR